jgi:outer membrane protein W
MRHLVTANALAAAALAPATARADSEETVLAVHLTSILPQEGTHAGADGVGAELRFFDDDEMMTGGFSAFAAFGRQGADERRDVLDVRFHLAMKPEDAGRVAPYAGVGLDLLHVTTHLPGPDAMTARGTTLGVSVEAGVMGKASRRWFYRASVGYLGAIVPGTGDDLGGVVVQLGVGRMIDD